MHMHAYSTDARHNAGDKCSSVMHPTSAPQTQLWRSRERKRMVYGTCCQKLIDLKHKVVGSLDDEITP